jgi:hypothetical protein
MTCDGCQDNVDEESVVAALNAEATLFSPCPNLDSLFRPGIWMDAAFGSWQFCPDKEIRTFLGLNNS